MAKVPKHLYVIPLLSKALDVLEALENSEQSMTVEDVQQKTKGSRVTISRSLNTLAHRGYVAKRGEGQFERIRPRGKSVIGVISSAAESNFHLAVTKSLMQAAAAAGIDLLIHDPVDQPAEATVAMNSLLSQKVDLVIEFKLSPPVAALVGDIAGQAEVPLIAVDMPYPNAVFVGVDHYRAGLQAGKQLAQHALEHWSGQVECVLGLDVLNTDPLVKCRTTAAIESVRDCIPTLPPNSCVRIDGFQERKSTKALIADYLLHRPTLDHILIAAATDQIALGVLDAVKEQRSDLKVAIITHDPSIETTVEMSSVRSPVIGSTVRSAHSYGRLLIETATALLEGSAVPPYNYVDVSFTHKSGRSEPAFLPPGFKGQVQRSEVTMLHV